MLKEIISVLITCVLLVVLVLLGGYLEFTEGFMFIWCVLSLILTFLVYKGLNIIFKLGENE